MTDWSHRAADAVAGFTSTRSKGPDALFGGPGGPTHLVRVAGCRVETADGRSLVDWTMALGAVSLGYAHPLVVEAAARAVRDGAVGPLPPTLEVRVAERLAEVIPGAKQVRFFKTGAEAVAAAVRLARAATQRDRVVYCGYHGWLDGPTSGAGVPADVAAHWQSVPFGDVGALEAAIKPAPPAAILLEPVIERAPPLEWLGAARRLADQHGAVLIFDEIKTAFRLARGGAAQAFGVTPDLTVLGKALANGFPLAAVTGRADLMARVRETWISSTLATEFVSLAAADAVLDVWEKEDVAGHINGVGMQLMKGLAAVLVAPGRAPHAPMPLCPSLLGLPAMSFLAFADPDLERRFLLACASRGFLLKRGAYNFPSLAHGEAEVKATVDAVRDAWREVSA